LFTKEQLEALPQELEALVERISRTRPHREQLDEFKEQLTTRRRILDGIVKTGNDVERALAERALAMVVVCEKRLDESVHDADLIQAREDIDNMNMDVFLEYLVSPEPELRIRAMQKAVEIEFEATVDSMKARLEVEADLHVLATMVKSIGLLAGEYELDIMRQSLAHDCPRVRANAIEGMCKTDHQNKYCLFRAMLGDPHHRVRLNAAIALEAIEPGQVEAQVIDLFNSEAPMARRAALWASSRLEERKHIGTLVAALKDVHPDVCLHALALLKEHESVGLARTLSEFLDIRPLGSVLYEASKERLIALQASTQNKVAAIARTAIENVIGARPQAPVEDNASDAAKDLRPMGTLPPGQRKLRPPKEGSAPKRKEMPVYVRLAGRVIDGRRSNGLKQATVRISSSGRQEITDNNGRFYFERLEGLNVYVFVCEKMGYPTTTFRYRASGQKDQSVVIRMRNRGK